jgi:tetratricopeptide (TPR) repeat protein
MRYGRRFALALGFFALGALAHAELEQGRRAVFSPDLYRGKEPAAAAASLLDGALQLAGDGSWERIAVGRAWYLGGDKPKGQQLFDQVTNSRKVEGSDWFRIARVYEEAGEWDKARGAFDRALGIDPDDDSGMLEYGAFANLHTERATAEAQFDRAFRKNPREFWHWVGAGASYLGVRPQ